MKKAILLVSCGATNPAILNQAKQNLEARLQETFSGYAVRRAFTSRKIVQFLAEKQGIYVDTEQAAFERLMQEGYRQVVVQPLHIAVGEEYEKVKWIVSKYVHSKTKDFDVVTIGRPLLYFAGHNEKADDYLAVAHACEQKVSTMRSDEALVLVGKGGIHPANTAYAMLQLKIDYAKIPRLFVCTESGFPEVTALIEKCEAAKVKKVIVWPLRMDQQAEPSETLVALVNSLEAKEIVVQLEMQAFRENVAIQQLYLEHLQDAIASSERFLLRKNKRI
ncbi:MAG: sirohydrochlorin cobaltochelatase [Sporomusaceae bacterium]|nr:sirohydrochlorin cobaltochelatase [Sporomusaceae bacterium]